MPAPLDDPVLREVWRCLGMAGDFDVAMGRPPVRRAIEAAARALHLRQARRLAARRHGRPPAPCPATPPTPDDTSPERTDD